MICIKIICSLIFPLNHVHKSIMQSPNNQDEWLRLICHDFAKTFLEESNIHDNNNDFTFTTRKKYPKHRIPLFLIIMIIRNQEE